ncbi:Por secretion system C-terminal sorting domain-containing protein [Tenacibaculum sp. MAR_2009_124]|uniref:T9SS type A sorting domain-containing protein n=1 Tax=Tenacibaculum sp. MAR_2009_124 TaxID=1250059 RepID=UPI000897143C|nr:T9SS type A sorting domain-containing protein [Tenacibaculum sp. MAR_2009_124]SEB80131.1 Por secretion system C-terminal sorting domain-containing protein [Tenacibaculum sp. MAR_2009_124]
MKKRYFFIVVLTILFSTCKTKDNSEITKPLNKYKKEKKDHNPDKNAIWTPEQAIRHQKILEKIGASKVKSPKRNLNSNTYANGKLKGNWKNRGPKNMPGAFKFAEMLDGTDVIYGVTHNHYVGEYNSKSYIFKGTVYNPERGSGGDDFQLLTENWPNRYQNLFAFEINGAVRLIAHIENGPLYFSDDDGQTWVRSNGLPDTLKSSIVNRQDNHVVYVTDNRKIYYSTDFGQNFTELKDFGSSESSFLYTPRYTIQQEANSVYLARSGNFYMLNAAKTDFVLKGSYSSNHGENQFSIGGDKRVLYVTQSKNYWVSTDNGVNWVEKFPKGNWYGDRTGKMSAGKFFSAHPENPNISLGGYAQPIISFDKLDNALSTTSGWGRYQNGTNLNAPDYYNRIRFNYHPDFQASQFFYNSSGDLFSTRCSDGGIFVSYKEWLDFPDEGTAFNNNGYENSHYININVLHTINPLIYRKNLFTGINNPNHIYYSTQDQGSGSIIEDTNEDVLDFYQSIGGDGPPIDSYDGEHAWKWQREGKKVFAPVKVYSNAGNFQSIGQINSQFSNENSISLTKNSVMGWIQTYIDRDESDKRIWLLSRDLKRVVWNNGSLTSHIVDKGTNHVAALAQAKNTPNHIYMLQDAKVFSSNDRGDTFDEGIQTPFSKTTEAWVRGDIGSGIVLPTNDNWILFCGPSNNEVGSILSKDGGQSWMDVTGIFPSGIDAQTSGLVASDDGKFVFAGTDIGPFAFDVEEETWYSIAEGIGFFNAMDVDYIASTNTVRFGSWGSGILDFSIEETSLGTDNSSLVESFNIYPNPTKNHVYLNFKDSFKSGLNISIISLDGKKILMEKSVVFENNIGKIDVSNLSQGIYIVRLENDAGSIISKKLIIE